MCPEVYRRCVQRCIGDVSRGVDMSPSVCEFMYLFTYCLLKDTFNTADNKMIIEYVWTSCTS
jgi:hypothetical protein